MARGRRTDLASLVSAVGDNSPVDQRPGGSPPVAAPATSAALDDLVANPRNPRDDLRDLSDLATIRDMQLQPALVVTRAAYLRLYPDDEPAVTGARWVVINGCRRLAAAREYGRTDLDIIVKDEVARDRATLLAASVIENVGRQDFDVLEEAKAVDQLVAECGTAAAAAALLGMTKGWVSQRRALLQLTPELQAKLRAGELAVRLARSLARVPLDDQVSAWQEALDKAEREREERQAAQDTAGEEEPAADAEPIPRRPANAVVITKALRRYEPDPGILAEALREYLGDDGLAALIAAIAGSSAPSSAPAAS
jgi:ParB family chromosome partitioning protein